MKRKNKLALALSTVAFSCCALASGLAIGKTLQTQADETTFVGFEYDFKDDSIKSNLTAKVGQVSTWTVDTTGDGYFKNGTGSWAELYLTGNEIPMSTGNQMTVIEIDYTYETEQSNYFNIGLISKDSYTAESLTDCLMVNMQPSHTKLMKGYKIGAFSGSEQARIDKIYTGTHTLTITLHNGNATFMFDGEVPSSQNSYSFENNAVTGDSFYLNFSIATGGFAFDNIKVYQEIVDPEADEIRTSTKSFDGLEEKTLATVNADMLTVNDEAKTVGANKRLLESNVPDLTGTKYFAIDAKNTAGAETGLAIELTQGKNTGNYGHWWTAGEYLPYYLQDSTGVQEGYLLPYESSYSNRAYARVPAGFDGKVIIPVNSFEVMTWSVNSSKVSEHTQDANAMDLTQIGWFDIYGKPLTATSTGLTVGTLSVLGEDFADVASATVASTERAIAQIGTVTLASESQIAYARARYDGLSEGDKASVSNLATLTAAEATLGGLKNASSALVTNGKDFTGTEGVAFSEPFASAPVTVAAWIKVGREISDNTHVGTVVGNMARGQIGSYVFDANNTFSMEVTTNGNPKFEWRVSRTNKVSFVVENVDVRTGSWVHLAFVRNVAARQIECYVNGTLVGIQGGLRKDFIDEIAMIKPAIIGSDYTNDDVIARGYTPDFNGLIANVRVYDTLLDESALALDLADNYSKANLLGGVDFMSGEANEYYNKAGENAVDYFGWKAIDESELWATEGEYTIAIQGDTQMYLSMAKDSNGNTIYGDGSSVNSNYDKTSNLMYKNNTWLVNNKNNLNLQFLTHVGDLTDFMNYDAWATKGVAEMNLGLEYMDILTDGGVQWSMARGNHDGGATADRLAAWDNAYSYTEYGTNVAGYQGSEANMRNVYYTFTAGETEYMVFVLDYEPTTAALEWAKSVIDANQDKQVIITTHVFMNGKGELITSKMSGENSGKDIWDKLVSKCPNIVMVLCGHSDPVDVVRQPLVNDYGNTVWSLVVDESTLNFSGNRQVGVLALMKFSADGKNVAFNFYSPSEGKLFRSINQFDIELDLSFFESQDNALELDFSETSHGSYFTRGGSSNGNFTVQNGALYPAVNWAVGVYNKPISEKGTYKISLDFYIEEQKNFFIGLVDGISSLGTTHNLCFAYLGANKNSYIYNNRLGSGTHLKTIGTDCADSTIRNMVIDIVDGVVTFTIDGSKIGTYDKMVGAGQMYLAFHSEVTTAYVDNLKVEYTPAAVDGKVIYDNYGDVAITTDGYFSGALPTLTKSGHVFVGYSIDGALYPAGYELDTAEGKAVIAVFTKYAMVNGGSVKAVSGAYGIRFSAYVDNESKSYLTGATFGSIMAHTDSFTDGFEYSKMTMENLSVYDMRSMAATNFASSDKYTYFHTVIDKVSDVTREFACRGYVTVTYADGSSKTFYATVSDNRRTIKQIAQRAYDDIATVKNGDYCNEVLGGYSILTQAQRNTLEAIINK